MSRATHRSALVWLVLCAGVLPPGAQAAVDPTRPQPAGAALIPLRPAPTGGFQLSAVLHGSSQPIAIVNGMPRRIGERFGRYRIEAIDQHCVSYLNGSKRQRACLRQAASVLKPVAGRIE